MSCGHSIATATMGRPPAPAAACRNFAGASRGDWRAWLASCCERRKQRRALAQLEDHVLRDIGLTRSQALKEAGKPAWRA